jgi:hypothetical protein
MAVLVNSRRCDNDLCVAGVKESDFTLIQKPVLVLETEQQMSFDPLNADRVKYTLRTCTGTNSERD